MTLAELLDALAAAPRYRSVAVVRAEQLTEDVAWRSARGAELHARPGDWLLSDGSGSTWTVAEDIFHRTYRRRRNGTYAKEATVRAVRVSEPVEVTTLEGQARAEPGDWVLRGADGEMWPVDDGHFRSSYVRCPD